MKNNTNKKENTMKNKMRNDLVTEMQMFYNDEFVIADSYTVIEPGLSNLNFEQTLTHNELNNYMHEFNDFKLESIIVLPQMSH